MTCRSFCLTLTVALLLSTVHTAVPACGPGPQATCATLPATGYPSGIPMPGSAQPQVYYVPQPAPLPYVSTGNSYWTLSALEGKLHVLTSDGMRSTCEKLSLLVNGVEPVLATVADKQIRIAGGKDCPGADCLQGSADRVIRGGGDGALLTLEGNAKLVCIRQGKKVDVSADRVSVNLATGQVVSELGMQPAPALPVATPVPCSSTAAPPPPLTGTSNVSETPWRAGLYR